MEMKRSTRKPHNHITGYVAEQKCKAPCGGHIVIYDRERGFDIDADSRWIVMHEPSSLHVAVASLKAAREVLKVAVHIPRHYCLDPTATDNCPDPCGG